MTTEVLTEQEQADEATPAVCLDSVITPEFAAYNGDCVEIVKQLPAESIGYTIFSPPFASLYTYSNSDRDMGNCKDSAEFFTHFKFLIAELFRVTKPGRLVSIHCMNMPMTITRHGEIGIEDFKGDIIRAMQAAGFIFHSEVVIWKDPVTAMQRTKALGLLHKQLVKDSAMSRQGIPDYFVSFVKGEIDPTLPGDVYTALRAIMRAVLPESLVTFRKDGENAEPISGELTEWIGDDSFQQTGTLSIDLWQRFASPVWSDIRMNHTLQYMQARDDKDERHICPLQLDVIDRGLELWSNPGDTVLSPFMGIGSEGFCSILRGRKFVGAELKPSYFQHAVRNLKAAVEETKERRLF